MTARKIMIQGTGSYVGKSVVTAALCRYFRQEGFSVAPFKAQNMSNNSFVTADGGEIGRAQAFQAQVCGIEPAVEMNPILLKPTAEAGSQVVVLGKPVGVMGAREYHGYQPRLLEIIRTSLTKLAEKHDIVVIEGAGSPAEVNLRPFDIVNMTVARMASAPVILVGDINPGGVFAWLVGTLELLAPEERSLVKGFLINKFRGDISLLRDGIDFLETKTGKKTLGVLPFVPDLVVPEEDSIRESSRQTQKRLDSSRLAIQVILFPHISNSTDVESFETETDVDLRYLMRPPEKCVPLPDLLIVPGSKSTMADLAHLKKIGLAEYVLRCHAAGVPVAGICGGYQMLGRELRDAEEVESATPFMEGLGLLDVVTTFEPVKTTAQVRAIHLEFQAPIRAYEIHMGRTVRGSSCRPVFKVIERSREPVEDLDGASSEDGSVWGTYLHGLFDAPLFRRRILNSLRQRRGWEPLDPERLPCTNDQAESLATLIREHVDLHLLHQILDAPA
jgi:adenosylcobyric acid synthase